MKTLTLTAAILLSAVVANAHEGPTPAELSATALAQHNAETGAPHDLTREEMATRIKDIMAADTAGMPDAADHASEAQAMAGNMMDRGTAEAEKATAQAGDMGGTMSGSMSGSMSGGMSGNAGSDSGASGMGGNGGDAGGNGGMGGSGGMGN